MFYIKQELPINGQIKAKEVQLISDNGEKLGMLPIARALEIAEEKKLDLVLVSPNAQVPVCKEHDFGFKAKNAKKFIEDGNKVKITVRFRGRELNNVKMGENVLNDFAKELEDVAVVEKAPKLEGKNMFIILAKKAN